MALTLEAQLLNRVTALNESVSRAVRTFLTDKTLSGLARKYEENLRKRHVDVGFNLFAIVSDLYYRENFHSDILRAVLDPAGGHGENAKYLHHPKQRQKLPGYRNPQWRPFPELAASRPSHDTVDSMSKISPFPEVYW